MGGFSGSSYAPYVLLGVAVGAVVLLCVGFLLLLRGRRSGTASREREDLHRAVVEQVADGILIFDARTMNVLEANRAFGEMLGYEVSELKGRSVYDVISHDRTSVDENVARLLEVGGRDLGERRYRRKDGSSVELEVTASRLVYGGREALCAVVRDVSERNAEEARLREAEERYRRLVEQIPAIVYVQDVESHETLYDSPQLEAILGYPRDSARAEPDYWESILHPDDRERVLKAERDEAEQGTFDLEYRVRAKDGRTVWLWDSALVVPDAEGKPRFWQGIIFDITARKEMEEALRDSEERYRSLVDLSPDAVAVVSGGKIVYINEAGTNILSGSGEDVTDRPVLDFIHPDDREETRVRMRRVQRGEKVRLAEMKWVRRSGETICVEVASAPTRHAGKPAAQVIFRDITGRKRAERDAARQRADLVHSNAELERFAYLVAHDLRAPLRSLDGFSQALLEDYGGSLEGSGRDYLGRIQNTARKMSRMIDELLDLSRLTRASMERESVDLSRLARSITAELRSRDPERRVEVIVAGGLEAQGDRRLLRVALSNLLENAWKFTSKSPRARIVFGRIEESGEPVFFVRDNGVGFDMAYAGKLFSPFQRLHPDGQFTGTGTGLAAVARIVERHGGRVWAEGEPEKGATFYFTL